MKIRGIITVFLLMAPTGAFAASKEIMELQRDVSLMQEDIRQLQRSFDTQISALKTLVQQSLETSNRAATSVGVMERVINDQVASQVLKMNAPVAAVSSKVDQLSDQMKTVAESVQDLNASIQRINTQLGDVSNAIKVMQTPAAAPPPSAGPTDPNAAPGGIAPTAGMPPNPQVPPVPAEVLYQNARRDMDGGKADLALTEFHDFVRYYPTSDLAANSLFYIGTIHYSRNQYEEAIKDFDAVLERGLSNNNKRPDAFYYKGVSLVKLGRRSDARKEFATVIQQYPRTDAAAKSRSALKGLGFNVPAGRK